MQPFQQISRGFHAVMNHLVDHFANLIEDGLSWWARGYAAPDGTWVNFNTHRDAIQRVRLERAKYPDVPVYGPWEHVCMMVDCTHYRIGDPRPVATGQGLFDLQRALYSLYYKCAGFKGHTQMWPNGMYALCNSASLRLNDNKIGDIAGFEAKLAAVIAE